MGCGPQPATRDAAEFFEAFPREAAIVLQRSVELSALLSGLLVVHCATLAFQAPCDEAPDPDGIDSDAILQTLFLARVACMAPRPYWWLRERSVFAHVRSLPTPQEVSRSLLEIQSKPRGAIEELLRTIYYAWLVCATVTVGLARLAPEPSAMTRQAWRHLVLNFLSIAVHRAACMLMFFCLMRSPLRRGVAAGALDAHTERLQFPTGGTCTEHLGKFCGEQEECSICLSTYSPGDEIRKLCCGHCFHSRCLDPWLLNHRNRCPLCLDVVGLQQNDESE